MAKHIRGFSENLFDYYFWNIIVNINFFSDIKFEYYCDSKPAAKSSHDHRRWSIKIGVLENFEKITGKQLRQGLFFNRGL